MTDLLDKFKRQDSDSDAEQQQVEQCEHACDYCLQSDVSSVAKCSCGKWFCNTSMKGGSHIIVHLIKTKHSAITLHNQNKVGITNIECYVCEAKNIFILGNVNVRVDDEDNILIICRSCVTLQKFNDLEWDSNEYNSLISEKCMQSWLLIEPNQNKKTRPVTLDKVIQLEEGRKQQPNLRYEDIGNRENAKSLKEVQLKFYDSNHYFSVFSPLVKLEEDSDQQVKEGQTLANVKVRWDLSLKKKRQAYFIYGCKEEFDMNSLLGTEMMISIKHPNYQPWQSKGNIVKILNNEEVCLELYSHDAPPPVDSGFHVECIWASTTFKRMQSGLKRFRGQEESISAYLFRTILGYNENPPQTLINIIPQKLSAPNLPELNVYQAEACKKALKSPLALIQGPPGTGKTVTSATLVYQLVKCLDKSKTRSQILVCAPSNIVTDQLAEKIHRTGLKVVRLCSKTRESVSSQVEFLTLHNQVRSLDIPQFSQLQQFYQLLEDMGELSVKDEQIFIRMRDEAEKEIIQQADVICTTCVGSADKRLKNMRFLHVLIDEATQAIEPECLLPMLKGAKHIILVGDHRQLGPVVQSRLTAQAGLDRSMFERLVQLGNRPVRLQVQYRMHPELTVFPSNTFYEGTLQNGVTISDRTHPGSFAWPNKQKPMMFLHVPGAEQLSASGTSYINTQEAVQVEKAVYYIVQSGVKPAQIGIITPYKGQRTYLLNYLLKNGNLTVSQYKEIEVASVDGFQGREKDFIIISSVRSNDGSGIGFLTNPRRLNVTITRARYGLIVLGNANVLSRDKLWNNMLNYFKDQELLMEGSIPNLRQCQMKLKPPQKFIPERRNNTMIDDGQTDTQSHYSYSQTDNLNQFEQDSGDYPITQGVRSSEFGFTQIPDSQAFVRIQDTNEFKRKIDNQDIDPNELVTITQNSKSIQSIGQFRHKVDLDI